MSYYVDISSTLIERCHLNITGRHQARLVR